MSLRFRRSVRLAPGIRLNLGLRGPSVSLGPRGAGVTLGPSGVTSHAGIPGTGLSYRHNQGLTPVSPGSVPRSAVPSDAELLGGNLFKVTAELSLEDDGHLRIRRRWTGEQLDPRLERKFREEKVGELRDWLEEQAESINAATSVMHEIDRHTPNPQREFHFTTTAFATPAPVPLQALKLGFFDRVLRGRRRRREAEYAAAMAQHSAATKQWEELRAAHEVEQVRLRRQFEEERLTSPEAMHDLLADALHAIAWPHETVVNFEIEENGKFLQMDVGLPGVESMPTRTARVAARGLKLNFHELSPTQVRMTYVAHIHCVVFRVVGEAFSTLPTLDAVECSGFSQRLDPSTGHSRMEYVLSVRVGRDQWKQIDFANLDRVDPVASLERFDLRRDCSASGILTPITPFGAHDAAPAKIDSAAPPVSSDTRRGP
jgi:hypothetical protein